LEFERYKPRCIAYTAIIVLATIHRIGLAGRSLFEKCRLPDALTALRSIFILTCISLFTSFILLVVSMLDFGVLSLWMNPCASLFTVIYNISILVLAQRKRRLDAPSYFSTCVICAYFLAVLWLGAFSVTTVVLISWKGQFQPEVLHQQGLPVTVHTQRVQCVLAGVELFMLGGIAVKSHLILRQEGPNPKSWRPMYENDKIEIQSASTHTHM
jgi:hypothetical protein